MGFVSSTEFQREGTAINSEVVALDSAVDRAKSAGEPFPDGPWWERWKGFRGSWSQYFEEQVKPTPVLPLQDDGDLQKWSTDVDAWKTEFAKGQAANATRELAGPLASAPIGPGSGSSSSTVKLIGAVAAIGVAGYFLSSVGSVKRAFS